MHTMEKQSLNLKLVEDQLDLKQSLQLRVARISEFLERVEEQTQQQLTEAIYNGELNVAKLIQFYTQLNDSNTRAIKVLLDLKRFELEVETAKAAQTKDVPVEEKTEELDPELARVAEAMLLKIVESGASKH
jgi:hypothetical protein